MQHAKAFVFLVTTCIALLAGPLPVVGQAPPAAPPTSTRSKALLPVADYAQLTAPGDAQSTVRKRTDDLFNGGHYVSPVPSVGGSQFLNLELGARLSSTPVDGSDLIARCVVVDARAFLAGDKGTVYSSYTLRVNEALKAGVAHVRADATLEGIRYGGIVQYSNDVSVAFVVNDCEPLAIGTEYVLFMKYLAQDTYPVIQMAYAITPHGISAVDGNVGSDVPASSFDGTRVDAFLTALRTRIASPSTPMPLNLPRELSTRRKLTSDCNGARAAEIDCIL